MYFDLAHLRAIHRHLFQDVYEWAGDVRTVRKHFHSRAAISSSSAVSSKPAWWTFTDGLWRGNFSEGLPAVDFAGRAGGKILGDVNYVLHP
ncbi:MAG: Fic family protein [Rhizobiaceae bacterium]